jgi:hypothetical protein
VILPIYRPEITVYRRSPDGEWDALHGGTITNTLFYPMADEDAPTEAGFRRVVRHGTGPFFQLDAPDGARLIELGRAMFLAMPDGKKYDAITALALAKMRDKGLDLVRPGREPARAVFLPPPIPVPAPSPRGPARQLTMFGDEP